MVYCSCGKALDKIPDWLRSVKVEFVCNNCPNRKVKNIAFTSLQPLIAAPADLGKVAEAAEGEQAEGE